MNLKDLSELADRLEGIEGRYKALETMIQENGAAMAEILELMTKQGPDMARAVAEGLSRIQMPTMEHKAPQVTVTVPEIKFPPMHNDWGSLKVSIPQPSGPARVMTITKSK